jgi:hypothetical protein
MTREKIIQAIWKERERQVEKEGWTPEHDAHATDGSLGLAAACYAAGERIYVADSSDGNFAGVDPAWPFAPEWDKRGKHDRKRQLVIAAALIVAELERLEISP